jgi:alkylation response protein AidB-like acyl-CoA dehydrogenase
MDFSLSEEQSLLRDSARRFIEQRYSFLQRKAIVAQPDGFSRDCWRAYADFGWLGAGLPEDVGGMEGSAIETAILMEEFGRGLVVEPYLSCAVLAGGLVNIAGSVAQRQELLRPMIKGERMLALAHGEPPARGDASWIEARAVRRGEGWSLRGRKSRVPGGPSADVFIVVARTGGEITDPRGITLFLVKGDAPGLKRENYRLVDRTRVSDLVLDEVEVKSSDVLGEVDQGLGSLQLALDQATVAVCAEAVGAMEHVLWTTRDYLKTRSAFGTTLSTFQALRHRMADMLVELEQARSIVHRGLASLRETDPARRAHGVSATKIQVGQSARFVGQQGIQLHGGIGMTEEYRVGHYFKRLSVIESLFGGTDFHVERYGRNLSRF